MESEKPKCSKCESTQVYTRINTYERVCKTCGNIEKIEVSNGKCKKNK